MKKVPSFKAEANIFSLTLQTLLLLWDYICPYWFLTSAFPPQVILYVHTAPTHNLQGGSGNGSPVNTWSPTELEGCYWHLRRPLCRRQTIWFTFGRGMLDFKCSDHRCSCHHLMFYFKWLIIFVSSGMSLCFIAVNPTPNDGTLFWIDLLNDGWICSILLYASLNWMA